MYTSCVQRKLVGRGFHLRLSGPVFAVFLILILAAPYDLLAHTPLRNAVKTIELPWDNF